MSGQPLKPVTVPDGPYSGKWSGHRLEWELNGEQVICDASRGVRGLNIPVRFLVSGGRVDEGTIVCLGKSTISKDKP